MKLTLTTNDGEVIGTYPLTGLADLRVLAGDEGGLRNDVRVSAHREPQLIHIGADDNVEDAADTLCGATLTGNVVVGPAQMCPACEAIEDEEIA